MTTLTTDKDIKSFIDRHRQLLAQEREAEISRSFLLLSNCGPALLEQRGLALGGLGIVNVNIGLGGKTLVELERPATYHITPIFPPHTFRPGDLAKIEPHSHGSSGTGAKKSKKGASGTGSGPPNEVRGPEGVVYKVSDTRIVIAVDQSDSTSEDGLDLPDRCRLVKLANTVTYDRMDKALDYLENSTQVGSQTNDAVIRSPPLTQLMRVLLGLTPPSPMANISVQDISFFDPALNPSQKEAVRFALAAPEVACIHGPPGTGKTHTLIELIRQLTKLDKPEPNDVGGVNIRPLRLLVCAASNLAVDNILERLLALPPPPAGQKKLTVTRIGHPARVMAQADILDHTLEVKAGRTDQATLVKDVKNELEATLGILSGKGKGTKGKRPKGLERRKMWEEVKALRKEYRQREGGIVKSVLSESQIVLATCHSSGGRQLAGHEFDVLIIDEATQAMEAVCWIPIVKAKRLILAGDPMQLPPTILSTGETKKKTRKDSLKGVAKTKTMSENKKEIGDSKKLKNAVKIHQLIRNGDGSSSTDPSGGEVSVDEDLATAGYAQDGTEEIPRPSASQAQKPIRLRPPRTLEMTLFDRLEKMFGSGIKRMLTEQYRMNEQICRFPSSTLYSSKLTSHPSVASWLLKDLPGISAEVFSDDDTLGTPIVFFDTSGCEYFERLDGDGDEGSRCNENEAAVVKTWADKLISTGVRPDQIAIITPYQAQVTLLSSLLRPIHGPDLEIGTVDGMQGREKEAVIISLVRSNQIREVGFLKDKRRLNVAMTRAKRHLCIVGDSSTVSQGGPFLKRWLSWLETQADVRFGGLE